MAKETISASPIDGILKLQAGRIQRDTKLFRSFVILQLKAVGWRRQGELTSWGRDKLCLPLLSPLAESRWGTMYGPIKLGGDIVGPKIAERPHMGKRGGQSGDRYGRGRHLGILVLDSGHRATIMTGKHSGW